MMSGCSAPGILTPSLMRDICFSGGRLKSKLRYEKFLSLDFSELFLPPDADLTDLLLLAATEDLLLLDLLFSIFSIDFDLSRDFFLTGSSDEAAFLIPLPCCDRT